VVYFYSPQEITLAGQVREQLKSERDSEVFGDENFEGVGSRTKDAKASEDRWNGEFDPGSGQTLAARLTHASRTGRGNPSSGGRVSNAWIPTLGWGIPLGNQG